jgi:hypothetical protein
VRWGVEIDGHLVPAVALRPICPGEAEGPLAIGSDSVDPRGEPSIFVCPSTRRSLRSLLPRALGFVFGEGQSCGHLAALLRLAQVPACIDRELFTRLRARAEATPPIRCRLRLGPPRAARTTESDRARGEAFCARLRRFPLAMAVHDLLGPGPLRTGSATEGPAAELGEKALGVNALLARGHSAASALTLLHVGAMRAIPLDALTLAPLLARTFPGFGEPGRSVMVRPSLPADRSMPGALRSAPATSAAEIVQLATDATAAWHRLSGPRPEGLALLLQERIPALARGVLCTASPWERGAGAVAELTFGEGPKERVILLEDLQARLPDLAGEDIRALLPPGVEPTALSRALARLLGEALSLQDALEEPLELEFAFAPDLRCWPVQLRPCSLA